MATKAQRVRITGGELRGRQVPVPRGARPTEGRVREALFSIWHDRLEGARVLDAFAGSGVVALEAISRGALSAVCLEGNPPTVSALRGALPALVGKGAVEVHRVSLPTGLAAFAENREGTFDLLFADPPYAYGAYDTLLAGLAPLMTPDGELVLEHSTRARVPEEGGGLVRVDRRKYGECSLSFYRWGAG